MINGFISIDKPTSISSNKVLGILKYNLHKIGINEKIGHMGTLDPLATGVLAVGIGRATRLFDYLLDKIKVYEAEFIFGASSDTLDIDSECIFNSSFLMPEEMKIKEAFQSQVGEIDQIPPLYSAKSINGKKAYDLARKGEKFELKPKKVAIYSIEIISVKEHVCTVRIRCGGGTYVRAIGRDAASYLGTTAVMKKLVRIQSGKFFLNESISLKEIEENPEKIKKYIISMENVLSDFPRISVTSDEKKILQNGIKISGMDMDDRYFATYCNSELIGISHRTPDGKMHIKTWLI